MTRFQAQPDNLFAKYRLWFEALARIFDVEWVTEGIEDKFIVTFNPEQSCAIDSQCVWLAEHDGPQLTVADVTFSTNPRIPKQLAGLVLPRFFSGSTLKAQPGDELLARAGEHPVWLRRIRPDGTTVDVLAWDLPSDKTGNLFHQVFHKHSFTLIGLYILFGQWTGYPLPQETPASMIVDDPNLHNWTYGKIDYRQIVRDYRPNRYHFAIATIPFDAYSLNPKVIRLFADNPDILSLLPHGNNHLKNELKVTGQQAEFIVSQSVNRMSRYEKETGYTPESLIVPPHNQISRECAAVIARSPLVGVCTQWVEPWQTKPGQVIPDQHDDPLSGWWPVQQVSGVSVLYRFKFDEGESWPVPILALFGFPIVFSCHPMTFLDPNFLPGFFDRWNELLPLRWMSPQTILESAVHYLPGDGETAHLRIYHHHTRCVLDRQVQRLIVDYPYRPAEDQFLAIDGRKADAVSGIPYGLRFTFEDVQPGSHTLDIIRRQALAPLPKPRKSFDLHAVARRLMTEFRDRMGLRHPPCPLPDLPHRIHE